GGPVPEWPDRAGGTRGDRRGGNPRREPVARERGADHAGAGHLAQLQGYPPDADLPSGIRAAPVHGGEPPRRLERSPRRARARAGDFGLAADRSASARWSSADSRVGLLVA